MSTLPTYIGDYELSNREHSYIRLAIKQACRSTYGIFCHGAVLINNGQVLSVGYNTNKSSPFLLKNYPKSLSNTLHAEMDCLQGFTSGDIRGASLYVVRINPKTLELRNSKPCVSCQALLSNYPLKKVIYSLAPDTYGRL
jgi:deoxycytidylate deaminase